MRETIIKISDSGEIGVESEVNGIKSYKQILPDDLMKCIGNSYTSAISSGLLPRGCLSYSQKQNGDKQVCLLFAEDKADIGYHGTVYKDFPLPRLVFGFHISNEWRISNCTLGIPENQSILTPRTKMYRYPFSNVSGFHICIGNNSMPKCKSLYTLESLPYFILSMANNDDHYQSRNNKLNLQQRDLLEILKDQAPEYYYSDILIPFERATLDDFIYQRDVFE